MKYINQWSSTYLQPSGPGCRWTRRLSHRSGTAPVRNEDWNQLGCHRWSCIADQNGPDDLWLLILLLLCCFCALSSSAFLEIIMWKNRRRIPNSSCCCSCCTSQKPSHGDISETKHGIIDPLVPKRPEKIKKLNLGTFWLFGFLCDWATERPKGVKDEVKQAQRAATTNSGSRGAPRLLLNA